MKQGLLLTFLFMVLLSFQANAQLPPGSTAPNWTLTDIDGVTHTLYDYLDDGKMVALKFSATWCGPCWNYMLTGAMETFWEEHGPDGDNTGYAFYIESDQSTGMDDLLGLTAASQGNWVAAIPFPIIDLQVGQNQDIQYQIAYYPTLYAVCSDYKIYEIGQVPASEWAEWITSCTLAGQVDNIENSICFGDGEVSLEVSGGVSPISYDWSNGSSGPTLQNIGGGVYTVTITEGNGKTVEIENIVVNGPEAPITLANSSIDPVACNGSATGNIDVEIEEGTPPYSYSWSNGATTQDLINVAADEYDLVVTDNNGCEFEESFLVNEPAPINAVAEQTPEYCDQSNGTLDLVQITGGVGNYEVSASAGSLFGNLILDLPAGPVTVTVEDGNGCNWQETYDIEQGPTPFLFFSPNPEISCTAPTTEVTAFVVDGSGDYEFMWTTSNGVIVSPANQPTITVSSGGEYNCEMYDIATGCLVDGLVEVVSEIVELTVNAGEDEPMTCETPEITLGASGDPSYTIQWSTANGNIVSGANTYTPVVNAPGDYMIEVFDPATQCTSFDFVIIENDLDPANAAFQYQTAGLTFVGTNTSTGSNLGGYMWTFGDGNSSTDPSPVHAYSAEGMYEVCMSVSNGCGTSQTCQMIEVMSSGSSIAVEPTYGHVLCHGESTGSIQIEVNGGSGNYTYSWMSEDSVVYNTQNIADLPAGNYTLTINDDQGNVFIGVFTITQPEAITLVGSSVVDNLCFGDTNGSIQVEVTGGVGPFMYSFNNGPSQPENVIQNLPGGVVECVITDANGCSFTAGPYTIDEPEIISTEAAISNVRCFGESNGSISLQVSGGVGPYAYQWSVPEVTGPEITNLPAGQYDCQITDHNGCVSMQSLSVQQPDILDVEVVEIMDASTPGSSDGHIVINVLGGIAPYMITWNNGATGTMVENLAPGSYSWTVVDANGCTIASGEPIIIGSSVSTIRVNWEQYVQITPNPSNGQVVVRWEGIPVDKGQIRLVSREGKLIKVQSFESNSGQWNLTDLDLASGLYLVVFETGRQVAPFKLVILGN